jgi:hypothetical protein
MESASMKSAKVPTFDGEENQFQLWWTRFRAFAGMMKFAVTLKDTRENSLPASETEEPTDTVEQKEARKRNMVAMYHFTLAFATESLLNIIFSSETEQYPGGLAHLVVQSLMRKYRPKDTISRVEMRTMLRNVKMNRKQDPATLFDQLSAIQNKYNSPGNRIGTDDLIATVLSAAPIDYQAVLTSEHLAKGSALTMHDLSDAMAAQWRVAQGRESLKKDDDQNQDGRHETLLTAPRGCFRGNCNLCGRPGHMRKNCWELESNADRRPNNWRSVMDYNGDNERNIGGAAVGGSRFEVLF